MLCLLRAKAESATAIMTMTAAATTRVVLVDKPSVGATGTDGAADEADEEAAGCAADAEPTINAEVAFEPQYEPSPSNVAVIL